MSKAAAIKQGYTSGARTLAARSMIGLARTRVTPNALTALGVLLCAAAAILVPFEDRNQYLFYWLGAALFVAGSVLDILDGALARAGGRSTPFGAFLDSTTDRVSEGFVLAAIAFVFARRGHDVFVLVTVGAVAGSFLVSYTRARAEALGVECKVGLATRPVRVVILSIGLLFARGASLGHFELLAPAVYVLAGLTVLTTLQRIFHVRRQLKAIAQQPEPV
jgi:CDP-diacylglycerol--glycerol-3-phosphate 3-phosphatidyltransferase